MTLSSQSCTIRQGKNQSPRLPFRCEPAERGRKNVSFVVFHPCGAACKGRKGFSNIIFCPSLHTGVRGKEILFGSVNQFVINPMAARQTRTPIHWPWVTFSLRIKYARRTVDTG